MDVIAPPHSSGLQDAFLLVLEAPEAGDSCFGGAMNPCQVLTCALMGTIHGAEVYSQYRFQSFGQSM